MRIIFTYTVEKDKVKMLGRKECSLRSLKLDQRFKRCTVSLYDCNVV